jgi:hypothetical protein
MFLTRSRSLAAVAACVLLVAALTGCGADKAKVSSGSPTAAVSGTGVDIHQFVADVTGAMKAKGTAHMVMAIGSSAGAVADVDYTSGTAMRITMTTGPQKVNVVLTGGVMYLQQTAGGKYLKIGKSDPALGGLLTQLSNILDVGTVTIDGTRLTHYEITVDTAKAASAFGAAPDALSTGQPKTVTYDMYLDSGKLLRQIDMTVSGQKVEMKVSDWGKPVSIVAPPASQVMVH